MCQQVNTLHACTHTAPGPLVSCGCPSVAFHRRSVKTVQPGTLCPACAPKVFVPVFPPPQPQVLYLPPPPIILQQPPPVPTLPQITPGPGSHGAPLPVPPGTPTSLRWEVINGRAQPVVHYSSPTSNPNPNPGGRHGYNSLHGYDPGALPPGWGAQPNPLPAGARGYNTLHGYDPGSLPPGCKSISSYIFCSVLVGEIRGREQHVLESDTPKAA